MFSNIAWNISSEKSWEAMMWCKYQQLTKVVEELGKEVYKPLLNFLTNYMIVELD